MPFSVYLLQQGLLSLLRFPMRPLRVLAVIVNNPLGESDEESITALQAAMQNPELTPYLGAEAARALREGDAWKARTLVREAYSRRYPEATHFSRGLTF